MNVEQIIAGGGTAGLILALAFAVKSLWDEHRRTDADIRAEKLEALSGWKAQTAATDKLTDAVETALERLDGTPSRRR